MLDACGMPAGCSRCLSRSEAGLWQGVLRNESGAPHSLLALGNPLLSGEGSSRERRVERARQGVLTYQGLVSFLSVSLSLSLLLCALCALDAASRSSERESGVLSTRMSRCTCLGRTVALQGRRLAKR